MGGTNGAVIQSATTVSINNPWHLVAVADFNGDGHPDLVWQNPSTGAAQVWYMTGGSGSTLLTAANFTTSNSWRIVAASNFTGYVSGGYTSHAYLVWEDPVAGGAQFWYEGCTNCTSSSAAPVYLGAIAVSGNNSWRIVATADYNQDGIPDLVWQNPSTGSVQIWFMGGSTSGATLMSTTQVTASNSWHVVAGANYSGDGAPIMIWEPPGSATVQIWFMNVQ